LKKQIFSDSRSYNLFHFYSKNMLLKFHNLFLKHCVYWLCSYTEFYLISIFVHTSVTYICIYVCIYVYISSFNGLSAKLFFELKKDMLKYYNNKCKNLTMWNSAFLETEELCQTIIYLLYPLFYIHFIFIKKIKIFSLIHVCICVRIFMKLTIK